jgi:hypothetical protein
LKKILITAANSPKAYQLAHILPQQQVVFADAAFQQFIIPDENSSSYAHELLSFCLDHQIEEIFPLKPKEIKALAEAKVLFKEYGIAICIPDLLTAHKLNNLQDINLASAANYTIVGSYQELSSTLLSLGYPEKKFVLGRADDEGNLLTIDDTQTNLNTIWQGLTSVSFLQIGKLFNHKDFEPIKIYVVEEDIIKADVLFYDHLVSIIQYLDIETIALITALHSNLNLTGFFEICISGGKILRIKPNTL